MPTQMISDIELYVSNTQGHSARFAAGVERNIHDSLVPVALQRGARLSGKETKNSIPAQGELALEDVQKAIQELVEKGDPNDFDSKNRPKMTVLKEMLGDQVTAAMRDAAMQE